MIRCKFKCESKMETMDGVTIKMIPVTHGSSENDEFFKYTPHGVLEVGTINKEAAEQVEVGKEYYIDIITQEKDTNPYAKQLENEKQKNRALQIIREKYELKYGVRIFANGSEQKIDSQGNPLL